MVPNGLVPFPLRMPVRVAAPLPPLDTGTVPVRVEVPRASVNPAPLDPPVSVPTVVKDEVTTVEPIVAPVRVPAAAGTVIAAVPSKFTPLIALAVARAVAVAALPIVKDEDPVTLIVAVPAEILAAVRLVRGAPVTAANVPPHCPEEILPTDVREEATTVLPIVVPVNVLAAAGTVMAAVPSKLTPLMARGICNAVAVAALPRVEPEVPVTLILAVPASILTAVIWVRFAADTMPNVPLQAPTVTVPTEVRNDVTTVLPRAVPVSVPAAAGTTILEVPSKLTLLMVRAF